MLRNAMLPGKLAAEPEPAPGSGPPPKIYPCVHCGGVLAITMHTGMAELEGVSVSHTEPVCNRWMTFFDKLSEMLERRATVATRKLGRHGPAR